MTYKFDLIDITPKLKELIQRRVDEESGEIIEFITVNDISIIISRSKGERKYENKTRHRSGTCRSDCKERY